MLNLSPNITEAQFLEELAKSNDNESYYKSQISRLRDVVEKLEESIVSTLEKNNHTFLAIMEFNKFLEENHLQARKQLLRSQSRTLRLFEERFMVEQTSKQSSGPIEEAPTGASESIPESTNRTRLNDSHTRYQAKVSKSKKRTKANQNRARSLALARFLKLELQPN